MRCFIFFILHAVFLVEAQVPDSDIWIFELGKTEQGILLKKGSNVTNRSGYDNQPFFSPDNKHILFTSIRNGQQSDIFKYDLRSQKITQVTNTAVSEYSPMVMPDGKSVSVVVVEPDSVQRLWKFQSGARNKDEMVLEKDEKLICTTLDSVGYYWWLNTDTLLYYKLTQPHSLWITSLSDTADIFFASQPARSFRNSGYKTFFYGLKQPASCQIREYDWRTQQSKVITETIGEQEDFIWHTHLGILKSEQSKLFRFDMKSMMWIELADFSIFGIKRITRFAFSSNGKWLAVVDNK